MFEIVLHSVMGKDKPVDALHRRCIRSWTDHPAHPIAWKLADHGLVFL
jgi:hypothetical protein